MTSQTALALPTVTVVAVASHLQVTMKRLSVIVPKDGWVWPVSCPASMEHQQVNIFACAICAITELLVTCYVQTIAHFALMENATAGSEDGGDSIVRKEDALAIRKIAPGMANV